MFCDVFTDRGITDLSNDKFYSIILPQRQLSVKIANCAEAVDRHIYAFTRLPIPVQTRHAASLPAASIARPTASLPLCPRNYRRGLI